MKTTIKCRTGPREVTLSYEDPFNGPVSREFFCRRSAGAYVRRVGRPAQGVEPERDLRRSGEHGLDADGDADRDAAGGCSPRVAPEPSRSVVDTP